MAVDPPIDVGIDHFDQAQAEALEDLRRCKGFVLAHMDANGDIHLSVCMPDVGDGVLFRMAMVEISKRLMFAAVHS